MKTLSLAKESLRAISEEQSDEVQGARIILSGACSNRRTCLTRVMDCSTSPYIYC